jgi:hypothetical protein
MNTFKLSVVILFCALPFLVMSQDCGNCKAVPSIALFDLDVQVAQPELKGEQTQGFLEWKQLYWLGRFANNYLYQRNKNCVKFTQPPSDENNQLKVGDVETNLPRGKKNLSQYGNYLVTGSVKQSATGYVMHVELQSTCSRKVVAFCDVPFAISSILENSEAIAEQAAARLSPIVDKIKKFEKEERQENKLFVLGGADPELIKITPAKTKLSLGEQTEFTLQVNDCDGVPLAGKEIVFAQGSSAGFSIPGTIGGSVTPAKLVTDLKGIAKGSFKYTGGKLAVINAHALTQSPQNCESAIIGSIQLDALPAYKITVNYSKTASDSFKVNTEQDRVSMKANERKSEDVLYSFSLLYYPSSIPKDGDQIIIMPQFENGSNEIAKKGKSVVVYNRGYSEFMISSLALELVKSPFGVVNNPEEPEIQRYFSNAPLPPSVSLIFSDNNLVFFSGGSEFPEREEGLSPVGSSFGIEKDNKEYFPLVPKKITDPKSPYKWLYEFVYTKTDAYTKNREAVIMGRKETETATVQIWKSF